MTDVIAPDRKASSEPSRIVIAETLFAAAVAVVGLTSRGTIDGDRHQMCRAC